MIMMPEEDRDTAAGESADTQEEEQKKEVANGLEKPEQESAPVNQRNGSATNQDGTSSAAQPSEGTIANGTAPAEESAPDDNANPTTTNNNAMDLNVAYEALEQVRQANVTLEFGRELAPRECIPCLRERVIQQQQARATSRFQRFMVNNRPNLGRAAPCLTCGTPVCPKHRCPELKRENINICVDCAGFFSMADLFIQMNEDRHNEEIPPETARGSRKQQMNLMLDVYDRALLVLKYSSRYIEEIATALENQTKRNNQIGLGSSATGFASGIVGVAAAVTIFTPAGPPLLIASILFGGGATAASAGSEAVNYHSSANKMADTIYALHGMVHSIAGLIAPVAVVASDEANAEKKKTATSATEGEPATAAPGQRRTEDLNGDRGTARNWTRAAANALKPLTAGALSAASIVAEAREMRATLDKINAGNPCAKAEYLRTIADEIDAFPTTTTLAAVSPGLFDV